MDNFTQIMEKCFLSRFAYFIILNRIPKKHGEKLKGLCERSILECFNSTSPKIYDVVRLKFLRMEKELNDCFYKKLDGLELVYTYDRLFKIIEKDYLDIPEGSKLKDVSDKIFNLASGYTDMQHEKAAIVGETKAVEILAFLKTKNIYKLQG